MRRLGRLRMSLQGRNRLRARSRIVGQQQAMAIKVAGERRCFEHRSSMIKQESEDGDVRAHRGQHPGIANASAA